LIKSRAEDNTNLLNDEGPPTYSINEWPMPLYSSETIRDEAEKLGKAPFTRSHTNRSEMSNKESAYFKKGFAAALSQIQKVFSEE